MGIESTLTGHPDFCGLTKDGAYCVLDWKSREYNDPTNQLMGYLAMTWERLAPEAETAIIITVFLSSREIVVQEVTKEDLARWVQEFRDKMTGPIVYLPGEHCRYCKRAHECPAKGQQVQKAALDFVATQGEYLAQDLLKHWGQAKLVEDALKNYRAAVKEIVRANGPQSLGDGRELYINETISEKLVASEALLACHRMGITDVELSEAGAVSMSKPKLLTLIAKQSPRGQKGQAKEAFMEELRKTGGVTERTIEKLMARKEQEPDEADQDAG